MTRDLEKLRAYQIKYRVANREKARLYAENYRANNKDKIIAYRLTNKEENLAYCRAYNESHKKERNDYALSHREEKAVYDKALRQTSKYKENLKKYHNNRRMSDVQYRLQKSLRSRLYSAIKGNKKTGSAVHDLGCTVTKLKVYLESKFTEGMNWANWSFYGWHIDHIKPLSSFDLDDIEQLKQACHYTNLQPLWGLENMRKGAKYQP